MVAFIGSFLLQIFNRLCLVKCSLIGGDCQPFKYAIKKYNRKIENTKTNEWCDE